MGGVVSVTQTLVEYAQPEEKSYRDPFPPREFGLYDAPEKILEPFPVAIDLGAIIRRHQHRSDTLSNKLIWYGREVMLFVQEQEPSREMFLSNLVGLKNILRLGHNLPEDPWIIGDLVGEKPALHLYCKLLSMFSGQTIALEKEGKSHDFAKDVIAWIKAVEGAWLGAEEASQEVEPSNQSEAEFIPQFRIVINEMGVPELEGFQLEPEEPITALTTYVNGDIDVNTALFIYGKFQELMHGEIVIRRKIQITEFLNKKIVVLEREVAEQNIKRQQDLVKFKESTEQHSQDLAKSWNQITTDCKTMVQHARNETEEVRGELKEEKGKLAQSIKEINAQAVKIYNLEVNNSRLWGEICRLNHELANADNGWCSIM